MKLAGFFVITALTTVAMLPAHEVFRGTESPGAIQFAPATTFPAWQEYASGIASGDFNNDGVPDLVTVGSSNGEIAVALGKRDGSFGPWLWTLSTYSPYVVAVGKFDGKNLDAVVGDLDFGNALAMLGDGTGYFPTSTPLSTNNRLVGGIAVADFNGDGNNDLAMTDTRGHGQVYVFLGNGDGTFQQGKRFTTGDHVPTDIVAGDFNGDGKQDLAVLNSAGGVSNGSVAVLLGHGNGNFDPPLLYKFPRLENHNRTDVYDPAAIATGVFKSDKRLDLAVAFHDGTVSDPGYVFVLLGNGDGTFREGVRENTGHEPNWVAAADFNGDGNTDLVVANNGPDGINGEISVLAGNGDGTFQPRVSFPVNASGPVQLTVADFNLDGKPDVATVNEGSSTVSVLLNTTAFPTHRR